MTPAATLPGSCAQAPTEVLDALPRVGPRELSHAVPAPAAAPGRYLEVDDGQRCLLLPLRPGTTHLGRGFAADLRLEDQSVSRRHAIVDDRATRTRILDDRSANGTYVNGRRVAQADLRNGDVIVLGRLVLTFRHVRG